MGGSLGTPKSDYVICARPLIAIIVLLLFIVITTIMLIITKVNSLYGDVSRDGLWATGVLLLGAGGDADKHQPNL